jgi:hypothetical protein
MPDRAPRAIRYGLIGVSLTAALGGCTIAQRAEMLYFYQQRLVTALTTAITLAESEDPELADRLYDSEDELNAACRPLWEAADRRIEEREIESDLRWQVFTALESCTERTREVKNLLWDVDPDTAEIYLGSGADRSPDR